MVARTDNRNYPYPECDPPLVKDRSDISYLRDLAEAVNDDADTVDARIVELLEKPDSARLTFSGNLTTIGSSGGESFRVFYNATAYDNTPGSVTPGGTALKIRERGWYMIVSYVMCTNGAVGVEQNFLVRNLRNGLGSQEGRRFEGTTTPSTAAGESSMTTTDVMLCQVGDIITTQVRNYGVAGVFNWEAALSMVQVLKLDV